MTALTFIGYHGGTWLELAAIFLGAGVLVRRQSVRLRRERERYLRRVRDV